MSEYIPPIQGSYFKKRNVSILAEKRKIRSEQNRTKTEGLVAAPATFIRVSYAGTICKKRADDMEKLLKKHGIQTTTFLYREQAIEHILADDLLDLKRKANLSIKASRPAIVKELVDRKIVFAGCPDYSNLDAGSPGISL